MIVTVRVEPGRLVVKRKVWVIKDVAVGKVVVDVMVKVLRAVCVLDRVSVSFVVINTV